MANTFYSLNMRLQYERARSGAEPEIRQRLWLFLGGIANLGWMLRAHRDQ